ncbi:DDT domain-containing protein DDR4-like [Macadamia integrifolia]|uniref:DDT domain-containing protein DDR4-like n=1 Tax=Macadamia integrifolia TaxID=60698 RepID=UPI001C50055C|nr:DDT domain-containing protein DDR4-like [Macadamia integrifolia]
MMSEEASTEIHNEGPPSEEKKSRNNHNHNHSPNNNYSTRKERPPRACTARSAARLYQAASGVERKQSSSKKDAVERKQTLSKKEKEEQQQQQQCSKIITPLLNEPPPSQLPRWSIRSMWELASLLNFLHVFRPLLNITVEFSVEELETALITPNSTLDDIHIPLLKAIPPVTRMALGRATWVTVLCRKLRDWWHWVAEGEIPIVASHGTEIEVYKALDPGTRVVILKALCDIRVEQEDIRNYIDDSIKHGIQLSAFRKERIGGDSHGVSYWYEDDPVIGHRLYREIRKVEVKRVKTKGVPTVPSISCQWETVATNLDEFLDVSEKLFSSKNRTEVAVGKKLKLDMLPEIEKIHKRKERLLKKQHRQALLLDSFLNTDGLATGRSLRDRKPVTYTFDDFDRSINEAIKITKRKQPSPEHVVKKEIGMKSEPSSNGRWNGSLNAPQHASYDALSPKSTDSEETDGEHDKSGSLDRSNRRRQRPQRYSEKEFVEAVSDNDADFDSDDDIVGEAVYDEEYLRSRKQRKKVSSSSEGDEEYHWDENADEEEEEEEEEEEDSLSISDDTEEHHRSEKLPSRSRRGAKLRSVDDLQSGLRRSKRATRNQINYRQYELSESEADSVKPEKPNASDGQSDASNDMEDSRESQDSQGDENNGEMKVDEPVQEYHEKVENEQSRPPEKTNSSSEEKYNGVPKRRFLDLNELAPGTGFDDGPGTLKDENMDNF